MFTIKLTNDNFVSVFQDLELESGDVIEIGRLSFVSLLHFLEWIKEKYEFKVCHRSYSNWSPMCGFIKSYIITGVKSKCHMQLIS